MFRKIKLRLVVAAAALLVGGCAALPVDFERNPSTAFRDTSATRLGQAVRKLPGSQTDDSSFRLLQTGVDALLTRMVLAEAAERSLDVQYYIWHDDLTGRHFANALLRAADRGVRVRILLDDLGVKADDEVLLAIGSHANIEIRLFNPVASRSFRGLSAITDFSRLNRRMHNKAFIADNQAAVLGGRNIGDEYFEAGSDVAFGDLDVLMLGPGVDDASTAFDHFWNSSASVPMTALIPRAADPPALMRLRAELTAFIDTQRNSPYVVNASAELADKLAEAGGNFYRGKAHLLYDDPAKISRSPDDKAGHLLPQFANIGAKIQKELLIVSPYFIPGEAGVAWLKDLVNRGVRVTVLTNSLASTDVGAVHAGYSRYRDKLLEGGVVLYELKPDSVEYARASGKRSYLGGSRASLHAKTFVFDRRAVFIGSLNLDPRSVQLNTEIGVVCESSPLAGYLAGSLEKNLDQIAWRVERISDASGVTKTIWKEPTTQNDTPQTVDPGVSLWRRFSVWLLGLLPVESQL